MKLVKDRTAYKWLTSSMSSSISVKNMKPSLLSIEEIAAWSVKRTGYEKRHGDVKLPKFQRNAIWKPHQVELLWDSIMRGFPIGSFLLADFDESRGVKPLKYSQESEDNNPSFHLLDGQQRANAITLGFRNPWKEPWYEKYKYCEDARLPCEAVLWIDLAEVEPNGVHREFEFPIVTRSHPWGYKRSNPTERLGASKYKKAIGEFRKVTPEWKDWRPGEIPLQFAWPYEAVAPLPLCFLIDALMECTEEDESWSLVRGRIGGIHIASGLTKTMEYLETPSAHPQMNKITKRLRELLGKDTEAEDRSKIIPALHAPEVRGREGFKKAGGEERADSIETLFQRINMLGTPMSSEELIYALFKSAWPNAHDLIEELSSKVMVPSRLLVLAIRLVRARQAREAKQNIEKEDGEVAIPPAPNVREFRRLIDADIKFKESMEEYVCTGRLKKVFDRTNEILKLGGTDDNSFGLPPVLLYTLARSSPELYLLLLTWVDWNWDKEQEEVAKVGKGKERIILGALTTMHWFSKDKKSIVAHLWKRIGEGETFWCMGMLRELLQSKSLYPVIPPGTIQPCIVACIPGEDGWEKWDKERWQSASLWNNFRETPPKLIEEYYKCQFSGIITDPQFSMWLTEGWRRVTRVLFDEADCLLYGQRRSFMQWFPSFDPSRPDHMDEHARPWDYDHILPSYYVSRKWNIPPLVKELHGSIGNLRVWPMELNRSDQAETPRLKLKEHREDKNLLEGYCLCEENDRKRASIIDEENWDRWQAVAPDNQSSPTPRYLSFDEPYQNCRVAVVQAIIGRCLSIYRNWYTDLKVEELFKE